MPCDSDILQSTLFKPLYHARTKSTHNSHRNVVSGDTNNWSLLGPIKTTTISVFNLQFLSCWTCMYNTVVSIPFLLTPARDLQAPLRVSHNPPSDLSLLGLRLRSMNLQQKPEIMTLQNYSERSILYKCTWYEHNTMIIHELPRSKVTMSSFTNMNRTIVRSIPTITC